MRILDIYIARHVMGGTALVLAVLLALVAAITLVDELGSIGRGSYGIGAAIEFMLLTLPRHAFVLLPLAAVVGALIGLGTLAVSSELAVIRASGVSIGRIVGSVLKGALVLVAVATLFGEVVVPWCEPLAQARRAAALEESPERRNGYWIRDGRRFVNVIRLRPGDRVEDMFIYEIDAAGALRYRNAEWVLESVRRSDVSTAGIAIRATAREVWKAGFGPEFLEFSSARLESLSGRALVRYIDYLEENRLDTAAHELALWSRIVYPLATAVMIVLAVPLVLGRLGGAGLGQRILAGCLIAVTFHVVNEISGKVGIVYGLSPLLCAFAPTLTFLAAGTWMLRRTR